MADAGADAGRAGVRRPQQHPRRRRRPGTWDSPAHPSRHPRTSASSIHSPRSCGAGMVRARMHQRPLLDDGGRGRGGPSVAHRRGRRFGTRPHHRGQTRRFDRDVRHRVGRARARRDRVGATPRSPRPTARAVRHRPARVGHAPQRGRGDRRPRHEQRVALSVLARREAGAHHRTASLVHGRGRAAIAVGSARSCRWR